MKRNKGFTLIELLAVIVILAIIALIAVPVILNIIDKANKSAFKDTAYGILSAGELYFAEQQLEVNGMIEEEVKFILPADQNTLGLKGDIPEGSIIITRDGDISLMIKNSRYCVTKELEEDDITITEESDDCEIPSGEAGGQVEKKTDLQDYSWAEIQTLAQDDSANLAEYGIQIGDTITYEGKTYYLVSDERTEAYDGLVFMFNSGTKARINTTSPLTNAGGYAGSGMKTYVENIYTGIKDTELGKVIRLVSVNCNDGADAPAEIHPINVHMFLPSVREVHATRKYGTWSGYDAINKALEDECSDTFDYFKDGTKLGEFTSSVVSSSDWWLRSAFGDDSISFWDVDYDGYINGSGGSSYAVVPAFVIG